jgi:hypothetical protein
MNEQGSLVFKLGLPARCRLFPVEIAAKNTVLHF